MACSVCTMGDDEFKHSYAAALLGYKDLQQQQTSLDQWAETNFVASLTKYCKTCHKIRFLVQPYYETDRTTQMIVCSILKQHYEHIKPCGQS